MKKGLIVLFLISVLFSCMAEEKVTITKFIREHTVNGIFDKLEEETLSMSIEQLVLQVPLEIEVLEIDGIEKLTNIKRLFIGFNIHKITFIQKLKNLEVLILNTLSEAIDLDIIKKLPKLKILYIDDIKMIKDEINFQFNKELEFVYLGAIRGPKCDNCTYELSIKNVPKTLKYMDLSFSAFSKINKKLLDSLKNVPCIIVMKIPGFDSFQIDDKYISTHANIKIYNGKEILPEKYQRAQVYGLLGLDVHGQPLSKNEK